MTACRMSPRGFTALAALVIVTGACAVARADQAYSATPSRTDASAATAVAAGGGAPNDVCADATAVGIPSITPGSTSGATPDPVATCGSASTAEGVWYSVPGTGHAITASLCGNSEVSANISVYCGDCPPLQSSDCCTSHGGTGCSDSSCESAVCAADPFCCGTNWDDICANEARDYCGDICGTGDAACVGGSTGGLECAFTWCSLLGVDYKVLVHGTGETSGGFAIEFSEQAELCEDAVACGPVGACCGGEICTLNTAEGCSLAGGEFQGVGVECDPLACDRPHPGWNAVDVGIELTGNQPTYWSVASGLPATGGVPPFTILDPHNPAAGQLPGRTDPAGSDERVLRGFIVAWAVNSAGAEIRWNHLKGDALVVNYGLGAAWEYSAYAFQMVNPAVPNGMPAPIPGVLLFDGGEYDYAPDLLLLNFYATSTYLNFATLVDTELTLMPVGFDLRQETVGPVTTKASFTIWNQNETKLTGLDRCVTCWDSTLLGNYGLPNHFLADNLQTDMGKAQIDGLASGLCDVDVDPTDGLIGTHPSDVVSTAAPLVGVQVRLVDFSVESRGKGPFYRLDLAGETLAGMGIQTAKLEADLLASPPERPAGPSNSRVPASAPLAATAAEAPSPVRPTPIPLAASDRAATNEKGSLLIYPKVELRWSADGQTLLQDTFIDLTNDYPADVQVQMYFVNGDPPTP